MRSLVTSELEVIGGGFKVGGGNGGVTTQMVPGPSDGAPVYHAPSPSPVTIGADVTYGLDPDLAQKLIGYIELAGTIADWSDPMGYFDIGGQAFDATMQSILIPRMQMYCLENDQNWAPGPDGTLGHCVN